MNRIISDYIYPSVYTHLSVYRCDHVSTPTYLFIYLSIHPHKSTYLSVCPSFHTHRSIYLTLTPMRLCMSVYPFINISSCLSMYHSTMYLCTHPLPIYLCIRPSIQTQTQQSMSVCLSHLSTYPSIHTNVPILLCVSVYPYLSVPPPPPMHLMISIGSVTDCSERSKLAVPSLVT